MKPPMRGAVATSLVIQGIGSFAPFLTLILLARLAGPTTQGTFSTFKTWADLVSSLFVFGFPQAFVYLINKNIARRTDLLNLTILYTLFTFACAIPLAAYSTLAGYNIIPEGRLLSIYCLLLAFGIASIVFNRLVRAIYLTIDDGFVFALITSAPAAFVLISMVSAARQTGFEYDIAYFVAGILTCLATVIWVRRIIKASPDHTFALPSLPIKALVHHSGHTFLQSISFTLQPVLTISLLYYCRSDVKDVALFTAATIIISAVNVLFGIIAPIFFNRWSAGMTLSLFRDIGKRVDAVCALFFILGLLSFPLYGFLVQFIFGPAYKAAIPAFQIVSLAVAPVAFTRLISSAIHAGDRPDINTVSCVIRLTVSIAIQICLSYFGAIEPVIAAVWGWVGAEWAAAAYSWYKRQKMYMEMK